MAGIFKRALLHIDMVIAGATYSCKQAAVGRIQASLAVNRD